MADPALTDAPDLHEDPPPSPADRTLRVVVWAAVAVLGTLLAATLVAAASYRAVIASDSARANTDTQLARTDRQLQQALQDLATVRGTVDSNNAETLCRTRIAAALDLADRQADRVWRKAIADKVLRGANVDASKAASDVEQADLLVDQLGDLRLSSDKVCHDNPEFQPPERPAR